MKYIHLVSDVVGKGCVGCTHPHNPDSSLVDFPDTGALPQSRYTRTALGVDGAIDTQTCAVEFSMVAPGQTL